MAIPLTINGQVFEYPQNFDEDWGVDATGWAQAVTAGALYLSGGSFPLTAAVDFGSSFGLSAKSLTSKTANPATAGYLRLAKTDALEWRNNANNANLLLGIDGSDNLTFNGTPLGTTSLTQNQIFVGNASNVPVSVAMSGDATIVASGAVTIANGAITNAKVNASAAIALTKLATTTASRALVSDSSGVITPSSVTAVELGYLSGVTSSVQTQIDAHLPLSGGTMSGAIAMASNKITSLANGTAAGDAINFGQLRYFQAAQFTNTTSLTTTNTTYADTHLTGTFTPTSASNRVKITVSTVAATSSNERIIYGINRGSTHLSSAGFVQAQVIGQSFGGTSICFSYIDSPATTAPTTYSVEIKSGAGGSVVDNPLGATATLIFEEIL